MPDVATNKTVLPAGGGPFALSSLTVGIFLNDQPAHRFAHAGTLASSVPLRARQGWILPPGSEGICEYDQELEFVTVQLDDAILAEFGIERTVDFSPILGDIDPLLLNLSLTASEAASGSTLYRETIQRALAAQIVELIRPTPSWSGTVTDRRLRRVLDHIHDQLAEDLSLTAMAELAAMSPTHFSKAFRKAMGESPLQYVIAARMEKAAVLLRTTALTVAEVAYRVGYEDVSRFGQHFKRRFGATPAAFRTG